MISSGYCNMRSRVSLSCLHLGAVGQPVCGTHAFRSVTSTCPPSPCNNRAKNIPDYLDCLLTQTWSSTIMIVAIKLKQHVPTSTMSCCYALKGNLTITSLSNKGCPPHFSASGSSQQSHQLPLDISAGQTRQQQPVKSL